MNTSGKNLLYIVIVLVIGVLIWGAMNMKDQRSTGDRVGDAIDTLPQGVGKAADQLGDRTPAEKVGDAINDVKE